MSNREWVCATAVACAFAAATMSCRDIGKGGTGEMVVPEDHLRNIDSVAPSDIGKQFDQPPTTLPTTRSTTQPAAEVPLTISQIREMTLRNNLDIKVELLNPSIARENINQAEAAYEGLFTTDVGYSSIDQPVANTVSQQLSGSESRGWDVTPGLRFPLRTGGVIDINTPMTRTDVDSASANVFNPLFTSDVAARISQPLLRGGGIDVNAQQIRVAFYGYQQQQAATKATVTRLLAEADRAYWRLYAARETVRALRQSYDLAVAQLERARRQVRAGLAAEVEIVRAESGVSDQVENIIRAENTLHQRERDLKRMLNSPDLPMDASTFITPATEPRPVYLELDNDHLVARAMDQRMELLEAELQIAQDNASVRVARHELLPIVTLDYTYNINGLGGSTQDSWSLVRTNDFADHRVGVNIQIPLGNEAARSRLRQALLNRLQALATREQRELQIRQEVLDAADQLASDWQSILAARERVVLAQRLLDVEIRQFEQGLRTSTEVLNAQNELAQAKVSEISALTNYQIDQVDVAFATGTVLGEARVVWQPTPPPAR